MYEIQKGIIYEFKTLNETRVAIDLMAIVAVGEGNEGHCFIDFGNQGHIEVAEPYDEVMCVWRNALASPETRDAWLRHERETFVGPKDNAESAYKVLDEQEDIELAVLKAQREEMKKERAAWDELTYPLVAAQDGKSLLEARRGLRNALTDEIVAKMGDMRAPEYFYTSSSSAHRDRPIFSGPDTRYREFYLQLLAGFYMPCDFDVENVDPATRPAIREGILATRVAGVAADSATLYWAIKKVQRAIEEIDFYFGRDNYDGTTELLSFLEKHDALDWDRAPGRPGG